MGPNLHKNAILVRNTITITECTLQPHSNFKVQMRRGNVWIFQLKFRILNICCEEITNHIQIRLFWEIGSFVCRADSKYRMPSTEKWNRIFMLSNVAKDESEREKEKEKNGILMSLIWKLFCCVAFGWNLLLFTIAQFEYKCNARMHLSKNAV